MLMLLLACSNSPDDSADALPTLDPPAEGEGFQMSMFGVAPAYTEVWLCSVYDIPTTESASVNSVRYLQNEGVHHMTLSTTAFATTPLDPGEYDCNDLYGNASVMEDVVMMFGGQGGAEGEMALPEGVAATLPAGIQVLHELHYVNTTDTDEQIYSYLNAYTIPESEVVDGIWGGSVRDENIEIPAGATHTEWSRCVMNTEVDVQFLASHTHAMGIEFTIAPFDGFATGEVFYSNDDWHDPKIQQFEEPLTVPVGQGFEFTCTWLNPTGDPVSYGEASTDEMCNMAIVFTPFDPSAACEVVETSDGVLWEG